jgi:hypothetical protein
MGLLETDEEWERCLSEAVQFQMPYQLRHLFCTICLFNDPTDPLSLFNKFKEYFIEDFIRKFDASLTNRSFLATNECLKEFQKLFDTHGRSCKDFGLPEPIEYVPYQDEPFCALKENILGRYKYKFLKIKHYRNFVTTTAGWKHLRQELPPCGSSDEVIVKFS